ncbi:MAG: hypothetical protein ABIP07_02520 [Sphingomicrobium sp.]
MTMIFILAALGLICFLVSAYRLREFWVTQEAWMYGHPNSRADDPVTYWMVVGMCAFLAAFGAILAAAGSYVLFESYL